MALVSEESVFAAAEEITGRGAKVTLASVRESLGGGSPNAVLVHLKAWRSGRADAMALAGVDLEAAPVPAGEPIPLPALPEVEAAIEAVGQAVTAAVARLQGEERRAGEARLNALAGSHMEGLAARDRLHAEAVAALELRLSDAEADLDAAAPAITEAEQLRGRVSELEAEGTGLRGELAAGAADLTSVRAALAEAVEGRTLASSAAERAEAEAREWKAQLALSQAEVVSVRSEAVTAAAAAAKGLEALRGELTAALGVARAEATAAAKEASTAQDSLRRELSEAVAAARLAEQRLNDAQAAETRERTARERAEERAAALVERASRAEAELTILRPAPAAAA